MIISHAFLMKKKLTPLGQKLKMTKVSGSLILSKMFYPIFQESKNL